MANDAIGLRLTARMRDCAPAWTVVRVRAGSCWVVRRSSSTIRENRASCVALRLSARLYPLEWSAV